MWPILNQFALHFQSLYQINKVLISNVVEILNDKFSLLCLSHLIISSWLQSFTQCNWCIFVEVQGHYLRIKDCVRSIHMTCFEPWVDGFFVWVRVLEAKCLSNIRELSWQSELFEHKLRITSVIKRQYVLGHNFKDDSLFDLIIRDKQTNSESWFVILTTK